MKNQRKADTGTDLMPKRLKDGLASERLQIVTTVAWLKKLDAWRRVQDDLPNRSEAIRRLVEQALTEKSRGR